MAQLKTYLQIHRSLLGNTAHTHSQNSHLERKQSITLTPEGENRLYRPLGSRERERRGNRGVYFPSLPPENITLCHFDEAEKLNWLLLMERTKPKSPKVHFGSQDTAAR